MHTLKRSLKRLGRVGAETFDELKIWYGNRCATCGANEGKPHFYKNGTTILEKGHMHPDKKANLENIIPQCQHCNKFYKDRFEFDEEGRVVKQIKRF